MSSCQTCCKSFGFFNKELGCPKCNKVFCKKCLCYKLPASDNPKKTIYVCLRCSKLDDPAIIKKSFQKQHLEEILQVGTEEIESPVLEPAEPTTSNRDNEIRNQLDEIKNTELSTEDQNLDDIQMRLANLKGIDYNKNNTSNKILFSKDTRSEQEKIDDLLKQFVEEKEINQEYAATENEEKPGSVDDIERRLALLRGQDITKIKAPNLEEFTPETEQEEVDRTLLELLDEAKLPDLDEQELEMTPSKEKKKDLEELPFCEICNEDAVIRCLECENIFCHSCFLEFHDETEYKSHKTKPYQAPKESSE